jgi:hypothetical protein
MPVYFIECPANGLIKIGVSRNVESRLATLSTASPVELRLLGVIDGCRADEDKLHQRFAADRHHGEWFSPSPELSRYIEQNARPLELADGLKARTKRATSFRPSEDALAALKSLERDLGLNRSAVIELAVRDFYAETINNRC